MLSCVTCMFVVIPFEINMFRSYLHACSVFEAERPGCRFSVQQRIATFFYKVRVTDTISQIYFYTLATYSDTFLFRDSCMV